MLIRFLHWDSSILFEASFCTFRQSFVYCLYAWNHSSIDNVFILSIFVFILFSSSVLTSFEFDVSFSNHVLVNDCNIFKHIIVCDYEPPQHINSECTF